jgi:hypothetical protein
VGLFQVALIYSIPYSSNYTNMEKRRMRTDTANPNSSQKSLSQCQFIQKNSVQIGPILNSTLCNKKLVPVDLCHDIRLSLAIPCMYQNAARIACLIWYARTSSKKKNLWELPQRICLGLCKLQLQLSQNFRKPNHTLCLFYVLPGGQLQFSLAARNINYAILKKF